MKNSIKRAQSQAGLSFAERKNFRLQAKLKIFTMLVLLCLTATGAWAQQETLLTTILNMSVNKNFTSGSKTFDNKVTVTFSDNVNNDGTNWGWYWHTTSERTLTVTAAEGITITRVKFYNMSGSAFDEDAPFEAILVKDGNNIITKVNGTSLGQGGVTKIEVYGIAPPEVTFNADKTEASFDMSAYDLTVDYELVRDMEIDVDADIAERIRIKNNGGNYEPVDATLMVPVITDKLDGASTVLTATTDYTVTLQMKDGENWVDADNLEVATYRFKVTGAGLYDGVCYTNEFRLFQGYEVEVGAESFATFYKDEKLTVEESSTTGELYTISSVSADEAVLSAQIGVAPANTPLLVYNSGSEKKTILLIPTEDDADDVTFASEFKGTLVASTIAASTENQTNYALNGKQFVWVKNALSIGANKCWLEVVNSNARAISILFGEATGISTAVTTVPADGDWYDLNGRKVTAPTRKGIYIHNGKKVVIK